MTAKTGLLLIVSVLPAAGACDGFVGRWMWFVGGEVTASANGAFVQRSGNSGTWTCTDAARGIVTMRWKNGFVNTMSISVDGRSLASADPAQAFVKASRIGQGGRDGNLRTFPTREPAPLPGRNEVRPGMNPPLPSPGVPPEMPPASPSNARTTAVPPVSSISASQIARAETIFEESRHAAAKGRCSQVFPQLDQVIQLNPRHWRALSDRGRCRASLGQQAAGLEDLNQAVAVAPNEMGPYYNRAGLRADAGDGAGALADLDRSIRLSPMNAAPRAARAALFELIGRQQEAQMELATASKQVDTFHSASRGILEQVLRTWRAKRVRPVTIVPAQGGNVIEAAKRAMEAGQERAALAALDMAIGGRVPNAALVAFRGRLLREIGQATQALADFNAALQQAPNAALYVERGLVYRQLCLFREEVADYTQAIRLNPNYTPAYIERAFSTMYYDKRLDAIPDLTKVIELDPKNWLAYNYRGQMNRYWFHLREAIADFRKSISIHPSFAQTHCNLGLALREGKVIADADRAFERCYALDPTEREVVRKEVQKIQAKEAQGARDLAAHMEWVRNRPKGGDTKFTCNNNGGTWFGPERPHDGGWCME